MDIGTQWSCIWPKEFLKLRQTSLETATDETVQNINSCIYFGIMFTRKLTSSRQN